LLILKQVYQQTDKNKKIKQYNMKKFTNPKTLKGQDKINRITDLMGRMTTLNESTSLSEIDFIKKGPNGIVYGIIRENRNYFIKTTEKTSGTLVSEDFEYVGGVKNKYDERYHSYAEALKHLNMKFDMLNESYGIETGTNLFESDGVEVKEANASGLVKIKETEDTEMDPAEMEVEEEGGKELLDEEPEDVEEQKKVIKVDAPTPPVEEPVEDEVEVDEFSMEDEGEDPFADEEGGEDMGDEEGMEEDGDETTKKIQKYTGKIGQLLRDKDDPDAELDKYVINSIISAIDWEEIPDEDVEDIISKIEGEDEEDGEGDEFATGDEEVVDLDAEEGVDEDPFADEGGEELAESEEDEDEEIKESRVFSKKQLMESFLKNATKKSLKKVLKENHRICEECLGEGCGSCMEEHHNMSHTNYGKHDRDEYMLEDDFLELGGDYTPIDEPERSPQSKRPSGPPTLKPDLNIDKYLKPRGMRSDGDLMSEKLKGKQYKLDRNKNGKIDAEDFKMLRRGKKQYMDEDMDVMDAIATGQGYLSATKDLDRDYDGIPNRLDMDADADGGLDFEMGSDEGYIEMDYDSIMGTEAPVKEPGIKQPTTKPGEGDKWRTIKKPKVKPKIKAINDREGSSKPSRRSFRRKGMFR
tara:strand:- start:2171 stop:4087 length:1917 start_codon:yes stop_codon:yes gene_type:complete